MPNLPKWPHELTDTKEYDGTPVAWQGDNFCDGCGCYHYTEETSCTLFDICPDSDAPPQHCRCWYDCGHCCRCGDHPNVLYGPVFPGGRQ